MGRMINHTLMRFSVFVMVVGLACNAVSSTVSTPLAQPTQPPAPTDTETPPEPTPTLRPPKPTPTSLSPEPSETPAVAGLIQLDDVLYVHPQGIFEANPPKGWEITRENDGSVFFEAPDYTGAIQVQVTNTGYELDGPSFERFVIAEDENSFVGYEGFQELDRSIDQDSGIASIVKYLVFDGVPQTVVSYYDQHGQAIYVLDFWADEDLYEDYADGFDSFFDSVTVYSDEAALQEPYLWIYEFPGPGNLFTIEVPTSWAYENSVGEFATVDTFFSPDEHAVIQNIAYDDGEVISRSDAGAFALELLREYYAADIRITDDQVQEDGSERLTWNSPGGDFSGISFFETRGTTFLLFTVMYDNPYEDYYLDTLDYTVSTYQVP